jgi:hypothetical protein
MTDLPDADTLFLRFFERWYDEEDRRRRRYRATKPDVERFPVPLGAHLVEGSLPPEDRARVAEQIAEMRAAVEGDWPELLGVGGRLSAEWIDAFDRAYDGIEVAEVLAEADETDFGNECVVLVCELGVATGEVLRQRLPELVWVHEWPYWESALLDPQSGVKANVFYWAMRKFSDEGVDEGYASKIDALVSAIRRQRPDPTVS